MKQQSLPSCLIPLAGGPCGQPAWWIVLSDPAAQLARAAYVCREHRAVGERLMGDLGYRVWEIDRGGGIMHDLTAEEFEAMRGRLALVRAGAQLSNQLLADHARLIGEIERLWRACRAAQAEEETQ